MYTSLNVWAWLQRKASNPCGFHHHAVLHPARGQACWYPEEDRLAQFRHTIPRDSGPTTTRLAVISSASHLENASCWMLRYLKSQAGSIQKTAGKIRALGQLSSRLAATLRDGYWSARLPFGRVAELPLKGGGDFFDAEMLVHCLHRSLDRHEKVSVIPNSRGVAYGYTNPHFQSARPDNTSYGSHRKA